MDATATTNPLLRLLSAVSAIGSSPSDSEQSRKQHQLLIYMGLLMSCGGLIWGTICLAYRVSMPSVIPYGYVVLTAVNFYHFHATRNFHRARFLQVILSLLLPFLFQWSLGGFVSSGAVMLWAMLALVGSMTFHETRWSLRWLAVYLALTVVSGLIDSHVAAAYGLGVPPRITTLFFLLNICVISATVFGISIFLLDLLRRHQDDLEDVVAARTHELMLAKDAAEAANRTKSTFLAVMSHEIRTPMNGVLGMTHLALRSEPSPVQRGYLNKIQTSANSLLVVINDILDFSKIEAGKLETETVDFSFDEVIGRVANVTAGRAVEKDIELLFSTDPLPPVLSGDPLRLGQILVNLVSNAVKFTQAGEILVKTTVCERSARGIKLQIAVRDTGIGMSEEEAARLFQPFTQVDASTTRKYGGTGLGLAISKRLVEMMGGEIRVESAPAQGSVFSFTAWFGVSEAAVKALPGRIPNLENVRALVVDDNQQAREILAEMLAGFSMPVGVVDSGHAALAALREAKEQDPYRIVLMDWRMPGLDGIQTTEAIRRDPALAPVEVMMVTAFGMEEARQAAGRIGVGSFLEKPVNASALFNALAGVFGREGHAAAEEVRAESSHATGSHGVRILVVEDNLINQEIAKGLLESAGWSVALAGNGVEAMALLQGAASRPPQGFDAVLMDVQMPEMDGIEATQRIRRDTRLARLPVIGLTAHAFADEKQRCLAVGMNDLVTKPIDPSRLFEAVAKVLRTDSPAVRGAGAAPGARHELGELAGVDVAAGLKRVAGNGKLYRHLLLRFRDEYAGVAEAIGQAVADGDRSAAARLLHTLKGVAGNVGAMGVHAAAEELEGALRGEPTDAAAAALAALEADLQTVIQGLARVESERHPDHGTVDDGPSIDPSIVAAHAEKLRQLLQDSDGESVAYLSEMRGAFVTAADPATVAKLEQAVDRYDFDLALGHLEEIAAQVAAKATGDA